MIWKLILLLILLVAVFDVFSKKHTIRSNFPLVGRIRYWLESIGPEMRQYLVAHNREEKPFNRVWRSYIYASAKGQNNLTGFGSDADFTKSGQFFIKNSVFPTNKNTTINAISDSILSCKKTIGKKRRNPYNPTSIINISAMSYGSLGKKSTKANNIGAKYGNAYHNIGEGGFSKEYHDNGADVVFQIGTGYFGCGDTDEINGERIFSMRKLKNLTKNNKCIKMIEIKLSQGAKPGKGGILPGSKVTKEIAEARGIPLGKDVISPPCHTAFFDVKSLIDFIEEVAFETGLPVGIKSAIGDEVFWIELAQEMRKKERGPDFITIDGGEGGTGAAPASFADNMSLPLDDALAFVYKTFQSFDLTDEVTFIASGKLGHPTHAVKAMAMGADLINIAREIMISAGCIQAQRCHTGNCPAGIATHNWWLEKGFNIKDKSERVGRFIKTLKKDIVEITHACGYIHPSDFNTNDIVVNSGDFPHKKSLEEIYGYKKNNYA